MDDITLAYLQKILDITSVGIIAFKAVRDEQGQIEDFIFMVMNTHALKHIPHPKENLIGNRLLNISTAVKDIGLFDGYVHVVETGEPFEHEMFYDNDNVQGWYMITATKLDDGVVVTFLDIDARKNAEAQAIERERLVVQFRKEFEHGALIQGALSGLVDDIRTPVSVIRLAKDLLLNYYDKLTEEKRREKLESIGQQLDLALELLDDTLTTVRGTLNDRPFLPHPINIHQLCTVCIEQIEQMYGKVNQLRLINSGHIEKIVADDILISRILLNLLSNAIKYSPADEPIFLEIVYDDDDNHLILRVVDTGIGIPKEHLPHIFEPFYRVRQDDPVRGAGLGLSIVKDCVARHGGTINLTSMVDSGTVVVVKLPFVGWQ
ncbi:MAG: HAMP domain-containing histidine kinase [Anaerolineae bacterium]|nr:HAMP domain-containing histidine kinase [Anaerolineae bacterium]